jgi:outer membrane protein assembly factor BamB
MPRYSFPALGLLIAACYLSAQSPATIADHILWERDFADLSAETAVADHDGNLWVVSQFRGSDRLVCIKPNAEMHVNTELLPEIKPVFPAESLSSSLAISSSGVIALLARYMHGGREISFDGANFAAVDSDGKLGPIKKVAGSGPDYKGFVALDDGHFLVLGDQSPMVVIKIRDDGKIAWRRTFPSNWVLPSAAALENGSSCVVSPDYRRPLLHMVWIDKAGEVRHQEQLAGHRSHAVSHTDVCTILYSQSAARYRSKYFLTSFDRTFNRVWTVGVLDSAPSGGQYQMTAVADGYVVAIGTENGLFLAKYTATGRLLWSATDPSRRPADFMVASDDGYYLVGAGLKDRYSLHVIRAH